MDPVVGHFGSFDANSTYVRLLAEEVQELRRENAKLKEALLGAMTKLNQEMGFYKVDGEKSNDQKDEQAQDGLGI
jgi:dsDNA-specific endonuclease/ATPase MutS2